MISFRINSHRFHLRAGAVALEAGHVLLHRLEGDPFWTLPGGRVEAGEEGAHTIVREFMEELATSVTCNDLLGIGENFFEFDGEPHHEIGLYYSVSLPENSKVRNTKISHAGLEGNRRLEFRWFPLAAVRGLDLRPAALRDSLATGLVPQHFVQRG
ncbi:NUDIX hydrolase [Chitinimonas taiwanensis]|uniref:NUDIX hydrolase n=1 Tax=Chitinimonas taiwanensis TaxID=240412 RepID=UPI0009314573